MSYRKKHFFLDVTGLWEEKVPYHKEEAREKANELTKLTGRTWTVTHCDPRKCGMFHLRLIRLGSPKSRNGIIDLENEA